MRWSPHQCDVPRGDAVCPCSSDHWPPVTSQIIAVELLLEMVKLPVLIQEVHPLWCRTGGRPEADTRSRSGRWRIPKMKEFGFLHILGTFYFNYATNSTPQHRHLAALCCRHVPLTGSFAGFPLPHASV